MGDGDHEEEFDILTKTGLKTGFSKPRAVLGRLPVRVELDKKNIDLDSIFCPSCDNVVESVDHCLVLCEESLSVWDRNFAWWGVGRVDAFTLNDMICHRGGVGMEKEARVLLEVVLLVAAYYIWKSRNLRVFKAKNESSSKVVRPALCGKHQVMCDVAAPN
ncbi:reverse transcriptase domain, reverse transcriptase zinc-binding domain protein [Tanacetum coccineum]